MIESLLVANRGEIAVRIIRTCRRLGIRTIAVFSDADADALHVATADEAHRIGPPLAGASYLNQPAILEAARASNAAAIHPGYGFLAENPNFAQAVRERGFIWVGPPPAAMRALGDKARAKALAEAYGVPLLPGYHGDDQLPATLHAQADRIGYPVLIKASAGGGGRGMRVVASADAFREGLEAAKREALASFGEDRVLLERYVERPRHIEVQILADDRGHVIHLGERECSIQRRHQKLIEESPSPAVGPDLRARMADAALRLARAAGYVNAGTVEFLLDDEQEFAFLEVNARLQVEHPVTELLTGLDLVELQLRVAAGEPLPLGQEDVKFDGHAIEARVIAEDPLSGFLPSSGTVERFEYPASSRVDTWLRQGSRPTEVSLYYDSLLAKVIAHAPDRAAAAMRLANTLRGTWIDGVADNVDLLLATIEHPAFLAGDLHTGFLDEHAVVTSVRDAPPQVVAAVCALDFLEPAADGDPWRAHSGWRVGCLDQPAAWLRAGQSQVATVSADRLRDGVIVDVRDQPLQVRLLGDVDIHERVVSVDGRSATVWDHRNERVVEWDQRGYRFRRPRGLTIEATAGTRSAGGSPGRLTAPMPARVVKIGVAEGQTVQINQPLIVLEAMKMEHVVGAPHAGVVTELCVNVGDQVPSGAQLLTLGSLEPDQEGRLNA